QRTLASAPPHLQLDLPAKRVVFRRTVGQGILPAAGFQPALAFTDSRRIRPMGQPTRQLLPLPGDRTPIRRIAPAAPLPMATRPPRRARQINLVPICGPSRSSRQPAESLRVAVTRARVPLPLERPIDLADRRVSVLQ